MYNLFYVAQIIWLETIILALLFTLEFSKNNINIIIHGYFYFLKKIYVKVVLKLLKFVISIPNIDIYASNNMEISIIGAIIIA